MRTDSRELLAVGILGAKSKIGDRIEILLRRGRTFSSRASGRDILISTAALIALMVAASFAPRWVAFAQQRSGLRFDVASVKPWVDDGVGPRNMHSIYNPNGVDFGARTLVFLIGEAYGVPLTRIVPTQTKTKAMLLGRLRDGYDISAKTDHPASKAELHVMLQSLLAERFRLALHREAMVRPVYKLSVARSGPRLRMSEGDGELVMSGGPDEFVFRNAEVFRLAGYLSSFLDRMVVDETGLPGLYDYVVKIPEELKRNPPVKSELSPDSSSAAVFTDVLKPLGLQLNAGEASVEYLVVDHVEKPDAN